MKNKKRLDCVFLFLAISLLFVGDTHIKIEAHPGRTNSDGCHVCRTNCAKWGLSQGEYHCHGGGTSSSGGTTSNDNYNIQQQIEAQRVAEEQERKRQEELAKRQAEKEKKQKEIYIKAEKETGRKDGYNYKIDHPDNEMEKLNDVSEYYKEAYESGYSTADKEIDKKSRETAKKNAADDAVNLTEMNLDVPKGVKKELYLSVYKYFFPTYETEFFNQIAIDARESAMIDAYDKNGYIDHSQEIEKKGREKHQQVYTSNYKVNIKKIEVAEKYVEEKGYEHGISWENQIDTFYSQYKGFNIYGDMKIKYTVAFKEGRRHRNFIIFFIITLITIIVISSCLLIRKKKRRNSLRNKDIQEK